MDDRVEKSDYARTLGVRLLELSEGQARLSLPFREENSNPAGALHGRCAASLGLIGGHVVFAVALGPGGGPFVTISSHVRSYLSAAPNEDVVATTHLSRKGKEIYFTDTSVETLDGKAISQISAVLRSCGASNGRSVPRCRATTVSAIRARWGRSSVRCPSRALAASRSSTWSADIPASSCRSARRTPVSAALSTRGPCWRCLAARCLSPGSPRRPGRAPRPTSAAARRRRPS